MNYKDFLAKIKASKLNIAGAIILILILGSFVGMTLMAFKKEDERGDAEDRKVIAEKERDEAKAETDKATKDKADAERERDKTKDEIKTWKQYARQYGSKSRKLGIELEKTKAKIESLEEELLDWKIEAKEAKEDAEWLEGELRKSGIEYSAYYKKKFNVVSFIFLMLNEVKNLNSKLEKENKILNKKYSNLKKKYFEFHKKFKEIFNKRNILIKRLRRDNISFKNENESIQASFNQSILLGREGLRKENITFLMEKLNSKKKLKWRQNIAYLIFYLKNNKEKIENINKVNWNYFTLEEGKNKGKIFFKKLNKIISNIKKIKK